MFAAQKSLFVYFFPAPLSPVRKRPKLAFQGFDKLKTRQGKVDKHLIFTHKLFF
jgi:hypothetical protein